MRTTIPVPDWAGGHLSHHAIGVPGVRGLTVVGLPYDDERLDVDLAALPAFLREHRPKLVVVGASLMLFPHRLREIADRVDVPLLYDASHMAGLIAERRFQAPLEEGANLMTFSTYKSFGGPPGGAVAADDPHVAARVSAAVHPGLTANYDAGRFRALHIAAAELLTNGPAYAAGCIDAARALAQALHAEGLHVAGAARGFTESHHVAVALPESMTGEWAVGRLARAGIYLSAARIPGPDGPVAALRLGTQELVRRGFGADDMGAVAALIARVLAGGEAPEDVRPDVAALRRARDGRPSRTYRAR